MPFVYSTLSASVKYTIWDADRPEFHTIPDNKQKLPSIEKQILIRGGANVASRELITPKGVRTEISEQDLALLLNNYHFKQHMEKGFIVVDTVKVNPDKVAKSQEAKDLSAPKTPEDYKDPIIIQGEQVELKPVINKPIKNR